jgi:hypothetical protein
MIDDPDRRPTADAVETALRERLARDEVTAASITPVLRYLLANEDNSIFSEEIVARVRGMAGDLARQLLDLHAPVEETGGRGEHPRDDAGALIAAIVAQPALLGHIHALALEWQLTERLGTRLALDPVLSPLLRTMIAASEAETAELAMRLLAAQTRFCQSQRRMRLPLGELPGDLLHIALLTMRHFGGAGSGAIEGEAAFRAGHDEGGDRRGLIASLVATMDGGAAAALSVNHAGVAIFLTALAAGSGQDRDLIALATSEAQLARLALALRAAGLEAAAIEEQFLVIHPDLAPPGYLDQLDVDRAAALLAGGGLAER